MSEINDYLQILSDKFKNKESFIELVRPMIKEDEEKLISQINMNYPNLAYKKVGTILPQVIIFSNNISSKNTYMTAYIRFNEVFYNGEFDKCLDELEILISRFGDKYFSSYLYKKIAILFNILNNKSESDKFNHISLLLLENYLSKREYDDIYYDFLDLITRLIREDQVSYVIPKNIKESILKKLAYILEFKYYIIQDKVIIERKKYSSVAISFNNLRQKINKKYNEEKFETCISCIKEYLLLTNINPLNRASLYHKLGLCYEKIGESNLALEIFDIANLFKFSLSNNLNEDNKKTNTDNMPFSLHL